MRYLILFLLSFSLYAHDLTSTNKKLLRLYNQHENLSMKMGELRDDIEKTRTLLKKFPKDVAYRARLDQRIEKYNRYYKEQEHLNKRIQILKEKKKLLSE